MKDTKRQSVFMQMHNGIRTNEGSFNVALRELFYKADFPNRCKLVKAFPEFFGKEVPEFGITKKGIKEGIIDLTYPTEMAMKSNDVEMSGATNKTFKYKGWTCMWVESESMFHLYTPDEMEQPAGFRDVEFECDTKEMCREFINNY